MQFCDRKNYTGLMKFYEEIKKTCLSEIEISMLEALRRKSGETYLHSIKVSALAVALGKSCQLPPKAMRTLGIGGLLHDVGKLKVPSRILNKKGSLDAEEMKEMRRHSAYGDVLLRNMTDEKDESVLNIVLHHHEKTDGQGYPDGLLEQHLLVQIVTVADIYDALRSDRCYRKGYDREKAFDILYSDDGINHEIVDRLHTLLFDDALLLKDTLVRNDKLMLNDTLLSDAVFFNDHIVSVPVLQNVSGFH